MAVANPIVPNYKPFYIQIGNNCYTTINRWHLYHMTCPFPILPSPKQPYKNDWLDRDGDDEYNEKMTYEAFEFDVKFFIRGETVYDIVSGMAAFFEDIKEGEFAVFDAATGLGRQKVRYAGYKEEVSPVVGNDGFARCVFVITFKVNDPVTLMWYDSTTDSLVEL